MTDLFEPTLKDLIDCADRELGYREQVYPRLVAKGTMSQKQADWQIMCMRAIRDKLCREALREILLDKDE